MASMAEILKDEYFSRISFMLIFSLEDDEFLGEIPYRFLIPNGMCTEGATVRVETR